MRCAASGILSAVQELPEARSAARADGRGDGRELPQLGLQRVNLGLQTLTLALQLLRRALHGVRALEGDVQPPVQLGKAGDRKSVVKGKSGSGRGAHGGP